MDSLEQMLEDYRNDERGLPTYEELYAIVSAPILLDIESILEGIDEEEGCSEKGWWETSFGAEFGARVKADVLAIAGRHIYKGKSC